MELVTEPYKRGDLITFDCETKYFDKGTVRTCFDAHNYFDFLALNKSDVVLDIGGHLGAFSIPASYIAHSVYAFEPMPNKFELLKRHKERHSWCDNLDIENVAVTDSQWLQVGIQVAESGWRSKCATQTTVNRFDFKFHKFVDNLHIEEAIEGTPTKIKLDCEGAEYQILKWLIPNMPDSMLAIAMELHTEHTGLPKNYPLELAAMFSRIGWKTRMRFKGYPANMLMYAWHSDHEVSMDKTTCQRDRTPELGFTCSNPYHRRRK